jgi:RHS repeat-associated protein
MFLENRETIPNRITYTGQQYDSITGQYYLRARYYNPVIGRFTQEDPYRGDGLNLYAYVSNNPVSYYDPTGYSKCSTSNSSGNNLPPWGYNGAPPAGWSSSQKTTETIGTANYIFYLSEWEHEAKDDRKRLAAFYGVDEEEIILREITSANQFMADWNSMGSVSGTNVNIGTVIINTHANKDGLYLDNGNVIISSNDISNLDSKSVGRLIIYGCNAGHLDHKESNPAAGFAKKLDGAQVLASDGTVYAGRRILCIAGSYAYSSKNDKAFKTQLTGGSTRSNDGWIIYQYKDNEVKTSESIGKKLTLTQMLLNMKKEE